ncbi:UDP-N-acetylmuramoyl-L-alanyl-D-glutamate--2,6-diaminopimelate ligase [Gemmatimonadota bacterium]
MGSPLLPLRAVADRLQEEGLLLGAIGLEDPLISGVTQDSREVNPGDLFLCWRGVEHDAHHFLSDAAEAGAVAAVVERLRPDVDIPQLQVDNGRRGAAVAADVVFGSPWRNLFLAGVTGTNGKTTTCVLARHLLGERGPARAIGTLGLVDDDGTVLPGTEGLTTPGPVQTTEWLRSMGDQGVRGAVLEASSHALAQYRLDGLRFDVAVFTNMGRDHLDYHPDQESYLAAKARLLDLLKPKGWAVVNGMEEAWHHLPVPEGRTLTFGISDEADLVARDLVLLANGSRFSLRFGGEQVEVDLPLLGAFNVENALAASGIALSAGLSLAETADGLNRAPPVAGRLEVVVAEPFTVLIDFAHTPDALARILWTLRPLSAGRLLVVFGAGGDRDRGKRPEMGRVVSEGADLAFVTSDNPRTEDPEAIIDQVVAGMAWTSYHRVSDRRDAIRRALEVAEPGDMVLLAGKGHETYQTLGRYRVPFDERRIVRELLEEIGKGGAP